MAKGWEKERKSDSHFNCGTEEEEECLPLPSAPESGLSIHGGWGLVRNGHSWAPPQMCEFGAQQPVFQQAFWGLLIHSEVGEALPAYAQPVQAHLQGS